jgi:peptide/nickel transport system substrate-binding protein
MGRMIKAIENELVAVDDRTFQWVLKKPYPKMLLALGKAGTPCSFITQERIAATDFFKQISEFVGSGPMRFARNERAPGAKAVFEKSSIMCRGKNRPPGWRAASGSSRIASNG